MTHKEQVLERALENLLGRIARGQEYPVAEWSVVQLYGVAQEDLMEAYDDFCCVRPPGTEALGAIAQAAIN